MTEMIRPGRNLVKHYLIFFYQQVFIKSSDVSLLITCGLVADWIIDENQSTAEHTDIPRGITAGQLGPRNYVCVCVCIHVCMYASSTLKFTFISQIENQWS